MKITRLETFLANAGLRNYLFVRLGTDTGLSEVGEATLEWQEKTVQTLIHEWVEGRVLGRDPFDVEAVIGGTIRDQYQGGATILTAISGVEIALWDLIGKACNPPVYRLLGGRCHERLPAYANGWYGGARTPGDYAERAREVVGRGYRALKFDPFGTAWKELTAAEREAAIGIVAAVREAVGPHVALLIEFHGRLSAGAAVDVIRRLERFEPAWREEPVAPECLDLLAEVKRQVRCPLVAGERLSKITSSGSPQRALPPRRRGAALRAGGFSAAGSVAGRRRGADGPGPLRRTVGRQEGGHAGSRTGSPRRPALLDRPGGAGRLPAL